MRHHRWQNKKIILPLLIIISFFKSIFAADVGLIRGQVQDEHSNLPISGVTIQIQNQPNLNTISNEHGKFQLTVPTPGIYILQASLENYGFNESAAIEVIENIEAPLITIRLSRVLSLPEMQVEGDPPPELSIGRTVISGKELEQIPGAAGDPMTALRILPGVTSADDSEATIAVRGSGPQDNGDYVDFLHVGYLFHGFPMMSVLRSDLVESFDLYAAGFGPEYGDYIGAIIDVKQREPREDRWGGAVNISILEADMLVEGPVTDSSSLYVAGRRSYIDKVLPKSFFEEDGIQVTEIPVFSDYQGKYVWRADAFNSVSFQAIGANDSIKLNITEDSKAAKKDPAISGGFGAESAFHSQGVVWTSDINHQLSNKLAVAHLLTTFNLFIGDTGPSRTGNVDVNVHVIYLRDELVWMPDVPHQFTFGAGVYRDRVVMDLDLRNAFCTEFDPDCNYSQGELLSHDEVLWTSYGYLSVRDQWRVTSDFTLSLGARFSKENYLNESYLEPRLGAQYQLNTRTIFNAAWGKYNQFPDFTYVLKKFGNPNLTHLKSSHSVIGVEHFVNDSWSTKVESYYKTLNDLVVSDEDQKFLNEGSGKAYGLEVLLKRHPVDKFSGWFSLTLSRSERTNHLTGETFRYQLDRPIMISAVAIYELNQRWTLSGRLSYYNGGRYTPVINHHTEDYIDESGIKRGEYEAADYGKFNSRSLPDYHRMDLRLDYDYIKKDSYTIAVYAEIMNIYNRKNVSGYDWNEDYSEREATTQLGTLPSVGVRVEW